MPKSRLAKILFVATVSLMLLHNEARATHFRYGNVTWTYVSANTVTFHITQSWRRSFAWNTTPLVGGLPVFTGNFFFGDGTQAPINLNVTLVNLADDRFYGEATLTHTYTGSGPWTAYFSSCCRISSLQNNFDGNFRVETSVDLNSVNNSPVATLPPAVNLSTNEAAATFTIPASDPDGNILSFTLSSPTQMGDTTLTQPPGLTIDAVTGVVTWNTIGRAVGELWNASVRISDGQGGIITLDFLIQIVAQSNPPYFDYAITPLNGHVYDIQPGQALTFNVNAADNDVGDIVTLFGYGVPPGGGMLPVLPFSGNPVQSTFSWIPTAAQLGSRVVNFIAQDSIGNQAFTSVVINVTMRPVFDYPPTIADGSSFCIPSGIPFSTTIQAHAPDSLMPVQIVPATIPAGASLTPALPTPAANTTSTQMNWTPSASDWGPHNFSFTVADTFGNTTNTNFTLVVNTQTTITSSPPTLSIIEGQAFTYNITTADADVAFGDLIEILGINLPVWLTLTDNGDGTATLSGTAPIGSAATYTIDISAEDVYHHCQGPAEQLFNLIVRPVCTLKAKITASPAVVSTYCYGQPVTLTVTAGNSYYWSTGDTTQFIRITAMGNTTYTVTVTSGTCSATSSYLVLSAPNVPPTAVCKNGTVYLDSIGNARVRISIVDGGSFSNCSGLTRTVMPNTFKCSDIGNNMVTLTVTNAGGLTSSCVATVTVVDTIPPAARCKNISVALNAAGSASISAADVDGGSSDNCNFTSTVFPSAFNCDNVGNNLVTLSVRDNNAVSNCIAIVNVRDTIPLIASCRNATVTLNSSGIASVTTADIDAGSTDNCSFTRSVAPVTFTCANLGANTATLTLTNAGGSFAQCQSIVTVTGQSSACAASAATSTIYLGYGPQSTSLSVNAANAVSYSWAPSAGLTCSNCPSPTFTPLSEGNYVISVTVTNSSGCSSTCSVPLCVLDVRVPGSEGPKIYVCHAISNNPPLYNTLAISASAVSAHIPAHPDDRLGRCDQRCGSAKMETGTDESLLAQDDGFTLSFSPNPFSSHYNFSFTTSAPGCVDFKMYDVVGQVVEHILCPQQNTLQVEASSLAKGIYIAELKQGNSVKRIHVVKSD